MSQLGKILLYVALAGGIACLVGGYMVIAKRGEDAVALKQSQDAKTASDAAAAKSKAEATAAAAAKVNSVSFSQSGMGLTDMPANSPAKPARPLEHQRVGC